MEWVIYNAELVNEGERFRGYLAIDSNGLIAEIGRGEPSPGLLESAAHTYDGEGALLIPGVIDTHVHFREPGLTHKGTIESESLKALRGGVTSFIDMPNCNPTTVDLNTWQWKMDRAALTSSINYAFYLGATSQNIDLLANADYTRVAAVKLFIGSSTGNMLLNDERMLRQLLMRVPALIAVHSESEGLIIKGREWAKQRFGEHVPLPMHSVIRSRRACVEGTKHIVRLAVEHNARLHVCHVSTAQELDLFTPGAAAHKRITAETSANYLTYTCLDYPRLGTAIKCNPAIKLP
ncbi:MAG: amidohydrolase family protein, partial [Muribaculaceae bacterium]|nr:amidohydrolase family protein [Muribaculaceae bacterium]